MSEYEQLMDMHRKYIEHILERGQAAGIEEQEYNTMVTTDLEKKMKDIEELHNLGYRSEQDEHISPPTRPKDC